MWLKSSHLGYQPLQLSYLDAAVTSIAAFKIMHNPAEILEGPLVETVQTATLHSIQSSVGDLQTFALLPESGIH